ncbi:MAG TPA: hypothetical protein VK866_07820 [Acidimicrobiales bacterium]|nr:hypothetical protein [Acidimicrobiales bacterium]
MLALLQRVGLNRGLFAGSSRAWLVVGTAAWVLRTARRLSQPSEEVVFRQVLGPGESVRIDHTAVTRSGAPVKVRRRR